jgi:hypothetical protein
MLQDGESAAAIPEIIIDRTVTPDRRIMIIDSFGQRVQMSVDQFRKLAAEGVSDRFQILASLRVPGWARSHRAAGLTEPLGVGTTELIPDPAAVWVWELVGSPWGTPFGDVPSKRRLTSLPSRRRLLILLEQTLGARGGQTLRFVPRPRKR